MLAAEFKPNAPSSTGVLKASMPGGVRNGAADVVDLLFLPGHLGNAAVRSPVLAKMIELLSLDSTQVRGVGLVNVSGSGKTKAVLDLLHVRCSLLCGAL